MRMAIPLAALLLSTACQPPAQTDGSTGGAGDMATAPAVAPVADAASSASGWVGRWVGQEGLVLEIEADEDTPGRFGLEITTLDGKQETFGMAVPEGIRFERDGREQLIRAATGDETGLRYLAGKKDCLVIEPGLGFCRD